MTHAIGKLILISSMAVVGAGSLLNAAASRAPDLASYAYDGARAQLAEAYIAEAARAIAANAR
jgi:hypothetical protein